MTMTLKNIIDIISDSIWVRGFFLMSIVLFINAQLFVSSRQTCNTLKIVKQLQYTKYRNQNWIHACGIVRHGIYNLRLALISWYNYPASQPLLACILRFILYAWRRRGPTCFRALARFHAPRVGPRFC